jgi:hypothetical protein
MSIFPKILPRAINGGRNWTNTQFLADLKKIILPNYNIEAPDKVLREYEKEIQKAGTSGAQNKSIVDRFKVLEQIQRDIYPPLQQYINLLNIEAWYIGRQNSLKPPPPTTETIPLNIITSTSPRIQVSEQDPRPGNNFPPDLKFSLLPIEVSNFLDFTVTKLLEVIPNGDLITYQKYPLLRNNWDDFKNIDNNTTSQSSFFLFSQLLTAYKAYKNLILLSGWTDGWNGCPRVENLTTNGFGRSTSHILDSSSDSKYTLTDIIGVSIPISFQVIPKSTPAQTTITRYKKADKDLVVGIKDKAINLLSF